MQRILWKRGERMKIVLPDPPQQRLHLLDQQFVSTKTHAILLAYVTFLSDYPLFQQGEGVLNEYGYVLWKRLQPVDLTVSTERPLLLCRCFLTYFTIAYQNLVDDCERLGGLLPHELSDIHEVLTLVSPKLAMDLLYQLIYETLSGNTKNQSENEAPGL